MNNSLLDALDRKITFFEGSLSEKKVKLEKLKTEKLSIDKELKLYKEALDLAKKCIEKGIESKKYIENIISDGLTDVFGDKHEFTLEIVYDTDGTIKGLKDGLSIDGGEPEDPVSSCGAGAVAIISALFRIAFLLLSKGTKRLLILDEPFGNLSPELQPRIKMFIENLCKKTGMQIIMITHMSDPFGKIYKVKKVKGKKAYSIVEEVK